MKLKRARNSTSQKSASPDEKNDILRGISPQVTPPDFDLVIPGALGRAKKGETWRDAIKRTMDAQNLDGVTIREEIARKVQQLARAGVPWAIQWLADREDGRPAQSVTVEAGAARNPMLDLDDEELARLVELARSKPENE